jgi:hypothetical protein
MAKPQKTENLVEEICTFVRLGVVIVCLDEVAAQGCSEHRRDGPAHVKKLLRRNAIAIIS